MTEPKERLETFERAFGPLEDCLKVDDWVVDGVTRGHGPLKDVWDQRPTRLPMLVASLQHLCSRDFFPWLRVFKEEVPRFAVPPKGRPPLSHFSDKLAEEFIGILQSQKARFDRRKDLDDAVAILESRRDRVRTMAVPEHPGLLPNPGFLFIMTPLQNRSGGADWKWIEIAGLEPISRFPDFRSSFFAGSGDSIPNSIRGDGNFERAIVNGFREAKARSGTVLPLPPVFFPIADFFGFSLKDDSAGLPMFIWSLIRSGKYRPDLPPIAATGVLDNGRIAEVEDIVEKVSAALLAGYRWILVPKTQSKLLESMLPSHVGLRIRPVEDLDDVMRFFRGFERDTLRAGNAPETWKKSREIFIERHRKIVGRDDLISEISGFIENNDSGILVVEGKPGTGKSALLGNFVSRSPDPTLLFPFSVRNPNRSMSDCLGDLTTGLHDLLEKTGIASASPERPPQAASASERKLGTSPARDDRIEETCSREDFGWGAEFRKALKKFCQGNRKLILVVDALDEADCPEEPGTGRRAFRLLLEMVGPGFPKALFLVVSCRHALGTGCLPRALPVEKIVLDGSRNFEPCCTFVQEYFPVSGPGIRIPDFVRQINGNFRLAEMILRSSEQDYRSSSERGFEIGGISEIRDWFETEWQRIEKTDIFRDPGTRNTLFKILSILVFSHSSVTLVFLQKVLAGWGEDLNISFLREISSPLFKNYFLEETLQIGSADQTVVGAFDATFIEFLGDKIAEGLDPVSKKHAESEAHRRIADSLAPGGVWNGGEDLDEFQKWYSFRFLARHLIEGENWLGVEHLLLDEFLFLEECVQYGLLGELVDAYRTANDRIPVSLGLERRWMLPLIRQAIQNDLEFLTDHPDRLFQSVFNSCWWFDCPWAGHPFFGLAGDFRSKPPWERDRKKLYQLMESWLSKKSGHLETVSKHEPQVSLDSQTTSGLEPHDGGNVPEAGPRRPGWRSPGGHVSWFRSRTPPAIPLNENGKMIFHTRSDSLALFPDGNRLVSLSFLGVVKIWDLKSGREVVSKHLDLWISDWWDHDHDLKISPDGRWIALGSKPVIILDSHSLEEKARIRRKRKSLSFSPKGNRLAIGRGREVLVWDLSRNSLQTVISVPTHVQSAEYSPDGGILAIGIDGGEILLWSTQKKRVVKSLKDDHSPPSGWMSEHLAFSPCGARLFSSCSKGVRVFGLNEPDVWHYIFCSFGSDAAISANAKRLAEINHPEERVSFWDLPGGEHSCGFPFLNPQIWSFCPSGNSFAVSDRLERIAVFPVGAFKSGARAEKSLNLRFPTREDDHPEISRPAHLGFLPSGREVYSFDFSTLRIFDSETGVLCWESPELESCTDTFSLSQDGKRFAFGFKDGTVRVLSPGDSPGFWAGNSKGGGVLQVLFSSGIPGLFSMHRDGTIFQWDLESPRRTRKFTHGERISDMALSPDGNLLASGDHHTIRIWNLETGREVARLDQERDTGWLRFSPDCKQIWSGFGERGFQSFDIETRKAMFQTDEQNYQGWSHALFSPDGEFLLTQNGLFSNSVGVWDLRRGVTFRSHLEILPGSGVDVPLGRLWAWMGPIQGFPPDSGLLQAESAEAGCSPQSGLRKKSRLAPGEGAFDPVEKSPQSFWLLKSSEDFLKNRLGVLVRFPPPGLPGAPRPTVAFWAGGRMRILTQESFLAKDKWG